MVLVESGAANVGVLDGYVFSVTSEGTVRTQKDAFQLHPGQAFSASFETELEYLLAGDEVTTLWIITVQDPATSNDPSS